MPACLHIMTLLLRIKKIKQQIASQDSQSVKPKDPMYWMVKTTDGFYL